MIESRIIKIARILAGLSQAELAEKTKLSIPTIKRVESERKLDVAIAPKTILLIQTILEKEGIEFVDNEKGMGIISSTFKKK